MRTLLVILLFYGNPVWITGHPSDPCVGTICGKGAQCKTVSNLVVCICPEDSVGDPFVECRSLTVTTTTLGPESTTTTSSTTTTPIPIQPSYIPVAVEMISPSDLAPEPVKVDAVDHMSSPSQSHDLGNTQNYNPSTSETKTSDDSTPYFPSAPPTLSHYAHSHTFHQHVNSGPIQFSPTTDLPSQYHQQLNQLYSNSRTRPRPQQDAHVPHNNAVSQEPTTGGNGNYGHVQSQDHPRPYPQQNAEFDLHPQQQYPPPPLYRNTEHRHSPPNNHFTNHHVHHNSFHSPPPHPHPHHYQSPSFNLKPETHPSQHAQKIHHDGGMEKDPLGKYENCRTINNIIVCADTSSDSEPHHHRIHPHPVQDHRYPAHTLVHGPSFNNFNNNDNKHNQLSHVFNPPHHSNNNFNEKHTLASSASGNSNYYLIPASKTEYGTEERPNHFQPPASRPAPITADEGSYALRPPPSPAPTTLTHPNPNNPQHTGLKPDLQQHFHDPNNKPTEPQPGSSDFALCKKLCGEGSVCRVLMGRPICGCPEGHTGDPAVKCYIEQNTKYDPNACQRHTDCSLAQFCYKSQCTDPCVTKGIETPNISSFHYSLDTAAGSNNGSLCGVNAICTVIEHNALCSCEPNHFGNPYVGCVV